MSRSTVICKKLPEELLHIFGRDLNAQAQASSELFIQLLELLTGSWIVPPVVLGTDLLARSFLLFVAELA